MAVYISDSHLIPDENKHVVSDQTYNCLSTLSWVVIRIFIERRADLMQDYVLLQHRSWVPLDLHENLIEYEDYLKDQKVEIRRGALNTDKIRIIGTAADMLHFRLFNEIHFYRR